MICARCGGRIELDECCRDCGIAYSQMLEEVSHSEMRRLLARLRDLDRRHERSVIDESLLVCELENSTLIAPARVEGNGFNLAYAENRRGKSSLIVCTDMGEFARYEEMGLTPLIMSWQAMLRHIEGDAGVVINLSDECCILEREFLERYFCDVGA